MPAGYLSVANFEIKVETEEDGNKMTGFEVVNNSDTPLFTCNANQKDLIVDAAFVTLTE